MKKRPLFFKNADLRAPENNSFPVKIPQKRPFFPKSLTFLKKWTLFSDIKDIENTQKKTLSQRFSEQ